MIKKIRRFCVVKGGTRAIIFVGLAGLAGAGGLPIKGAGALSELRRPFFSCDFPLGQSTLESAATMPNNKPPSWDCEKKVTHHLTLRGVEGDTYSVLDIVGYYGWEQDEPGGANLGLRRLFAVIGEFRRQGLDLKSICARVQERGGMGYLWGNSVDARWSSTDWYSARRAAGGSTPGRGCINLD